MDLQRLTWRVERLGWIALALVLVAGILGVFGSGPLSSTRAGGAAAGLFVEYERFARFGAVTRINIVADSSTSGTATLAVAGDVIDSLALDAVHPRPVEQRSTQTGANWVFRADPGGPLRIALNARPTRPGLLRSSFAIDARPPVPILQVVYP